MKPFFFLLTFLFPFAFSLNISFFIMDKEQICFGEFLSKHTLVVGSFDINNEGSPHYSVTVSDPNSTLIFEKSYNPNESHLSSEAHTSEQIVEELGGSAKNDSINIQVHMESRESIRSEHQGGDNLIRFSFASYDDGPHEFCLKNLDLVTYKARFVMKTGVEAKDYSVLTKKMELKELAKETFLIHTTATFIKEDYSAISELELHKVYHSGKINSNVLIYGCITLGMLILVAVFQYYSMKRFFKRKKII